MDAMPELENEQLHPEHRETLMEESLAEEESLAAEEIVAAEETMAAEEIAADEMAAAEMASEGDPITEAAIEEALPVEETKRWYIIHSYSGFERKVSESLRTRADAFGFGEHIGQILIPEEEVVELKNGKKVISKKLLYPGYVVIQMDMNDELWHLVKDTPRVTGFVGGGQTPVPLSADEINKMLYRQTTAAERPRPKMSFEKNENVRIVDGPFSNFQGKVDEINHDRNTLRVLVTIFGRATPVELDFLQVEKIA